MTRSDDPYAELNQGGTSGAPDPFAATVRAEAGSPARPQGRAWDGASDPFDDPYAVADPYAPGGMSDATARAAVPRAAKPARARRGGRRAARWILAATALVLLVVGVGAGAAYLFGQLQHRATAHRHVPPGSAIVLRADGREIIQFKPVREHLWPVLIKRRVGASGPPTGGVEGRLVRLAELTGVRIPDDVREVVVASTGATSWVMLVGGTFKRGDFIGGLEQLFREEGIGGWGRDGQLLMHPLGPSFAQADDGTLMLGTNAAIVRAALPESDSVDHVPRLVEGALSFHASAGAWSRGIEGLPLSLPGFSTLGNVDRVSGTVLLTEQPTLRLLLTPKAGIQASTLRAEVEQVLSAARMVGLFVSDDLGGAKDIIINARVEERDGGAEIAAPLPYDRIDVAIRKLARKLDPNPLTRP